MTLKDAIVFDIDGTLADVEHRRHHVADGKREWGQFFDKMVDDLPLRDVCLLAELLGDHPLVNQGAITLFLCSGRPETYRNQTEEWLNTHTHSYLKKAEALLMRAEGDYRADVEVKREMLRNIRNQGYDVRLAVDDRPSVIQMWKAEGVTVLEHDSGEWDAPAVNWRPGELHLLVGPSGAGKTSYLPIFRTNPAFAGGILSSDDLRKQITGTIRDQNANNQVFFAIRSVVQARINSGLNTVVDATNLHSRDRRAIRDMCPGDTDIFYHVIDRPLAAKHSDAGWRDDVVIKGVKLIDKHHQSFQSGLKQILRGDDDPRVKVYDRRIL